MNESFKLLKIMIEKEKFIKSVADILCSRFHFSWDVAFFVGCQFALESDFGTSDLAKSNHNYCGMKNPLVRISVANHAGDNSYRWAQYDSLEDCVIDFVLCLQYHNPLSIDYNVLGNYKSFIKWYCPEKSYVSRIENIYIKFKTLNF